MSATRGLESAFPIEERYDERRGEYYCPSTYGGLTKRELFAGLAMQGLIANAHRAGHAGEVAEAAIRFADALLKELGDP